TRYGSRIEYEKLPGLNRNKSVFSVDIKTLAKEGIIFYASDNKSVDFIAVYLQNGIVHYGFNCGSGPVFINSDRTISDDKWHTITFKRKGIQGSLFIDDILVGRGNSTGHAETINVMPPFYLGGIPPKLESNSKTNLKVH
ncbi:hypothetical protein AAG570_012081, partial [Ranatra chinensis]